MSVFDLLCCSCFFYFFFFFYLFIFFFIYLFFFFQAEDGIRDTSVTGVQTCALPIFPVGFVGAAESKQALMEHAGGIPVITLAGRLGGSPVAAAALNAIALGANP